LRTAAIILIPSRKNILIIKLGAAGDVLRTTPLLHKIKADHPQARIWWLTQTPELVPITHVDKILKWNSETLEILSEVELHFSSIWIRISCLRSGKSL